VFVDALAAGRPVVTTAGSWMARQLEHHGAGVVYEGATGDALADAIEELRTRWPALRSAAAAAAPRWRVGRHPDDVLRAVVGLFT
jgi:glycosyltransferase involved in cell wall biosynthesis